MSRIPDRYWSWIGCYLASTSVGEFMAIFTEDGTARHHADIIRDSKFGVQCISPDVR